LKTLLRTSVLATIYTTDKRKKFISRSAAPAGKEIARSLVDHNLNETLVSELDDEDKEHSYREVLEKLPDADIGKISLKDEVITVLPAFSHVAGSAIFVLVPFFFIHDEKSPSAILNALLISTIPGILLLFLGIREGEHRITKIWMGSVTALVAFIVTVVTPALKGIGLLKTGYKSGKQVINNF
jgi:VIT1/CCC1 family predicted Fe2+/Mn2+ transporter